MWRKALATCIDAACSTDAGHLSLTMAPIEYSQQAKPESHNDQQRDAGEMSPVSMNWDTLLDEFADVCTEPTQPQPRPI